MMASVITTVNTAALAATPGCGGPVTRPDAFSHTVTTVPAGAPAAVIGRFFDQRSARFETLLNELVPTTTGHGLLANRAAHHQAVGRARHADIEQSAVFVLRRADHIRARLRNRRDLVVAIGHPDEAISGTRHGAGRFQCE